MKCLRAKRIFSLLAILIALLILSACDASHSVRTPTPVGALAISTSLRGFYESLGGEDVLGPAIDTPRDVNGMECQMMSNGILCYNPAAIDANRFTIWPLGRTFGIQDTPDVNPEQQSYRVIHGYALYPDFVSIYDSLGGAKNVGMPISRVRYNREQYRIEQYFENLGFYRTLDDPAIHLLPYGSYYCADNCRFKGYTSFAPLKDDFSSPFQMSIDRLGGAKFLGRALTEAIVVGNNIQQVFEGGIALAPVNNPSLIRLMALPKELKLVTDAQPEPRTAEEKSGLVFKPTQGDLGFYVPVPFDKFIAQHGGYEISGKPIGPVDWDKSQRFVRQCFENYCLDFFPKVKDKPDLQVMLAPLGSKYLHTYDTSSPYLALSNETVMIQSSESNPEIKNNQPQMISIVVLQRKDLQPLERIEAHLLVSYPDQRAPLEMDFQPTDENGYSTLLVPPSNPLLPNGSLVSYQVCLNVPGQKICDRQSYLIWNSQ